MNWSLVYVDFQNGVVTQSVFPSVTKEKWLFSQNQSLSQHPKWFVTIMYGRIYLKNIWLSVEFQALGFWNRQLLYWVLGIDIIGLLW